MHLLEQEYIWRTRHDIERLNCNNTTSNMIRIINAVDSIPFLVFHIVTNFHTTLLPSIIYFLNNSSQIQTLCLVRILKTRTAWDQVSVSFWVLKKAALIIFAQFSHNTWVYTTWYRSSFSYLREWFSTWTHLFKRSWLSGEDSLKAKYAAML